GEKRALCSTREGAEKRTAGDREISGCRGPRNHQAGSAAGGNSIAVITAGSRRSVSAEIARVQKLAVRVHRRDDGIGGALIGRLECVKQRKIRGGGSAGQVQAG